MISSDQILAVTWPIKCFGSRKACAARKRPRRSLNKLADTQLKAGAQNPLTASAFVLLGRSRKAWTAQNHTEWGVHANPEFHAAAGRSFVPVECGRSWLSLKGRRVLRKVVWSHACGEGKVPACGRGLQGSASITGTRGVCFLDAGIFSFTGVTGTIIS